MQKLPMSIPDLNARTSWGGFQRNLLTSSCMRSCKDLLERTPPESPQDLLMRLVQDHAKTSCTISAGSWQDLLIRTSHNDLYKTLVKIFTRKVPRGLRAMTKIRTEPQQERSDTHKVPRRLSKFTPLHNENDLTWRKCRERCEYMLDFHTTLCAPRNMNIKILENINNDVSPRSQPPFRGLESTAPQKINLNPKCTRNHRVKTSSSSTAPMQNGVQQHLSLWPAPTFLATTRKRHACHTDQKVSDVLRLSRKTTF